MERKRHRNEEEDTQSYVSRVSVMAEGSQGCVTKERGTVKSRRPHKKEALRFKRDILNTKKEHIFKG